MPSVSQKTKGIFYILVAAFGFSLMSTFVKLAGDLPAIQKAFFRNFIALLFILIFMLKEHISFKPEKGNLPALFGRCFCGTVGLLCNFYAIGKLNLSDANMLNKLSPFFAILFSVILLKEKPTLVQVIGVLMAFAGSLCIIKPGFENPALIPAIAGAIGGMGAGAAYTFVRKLGGRHENSKRIVFYFSAFSCLVCLPFLLFSYAPMTGKQFLFLVLAGAFACRRTAGYHPSLPLRPCKGNFRLRLHPGHLCRRFGLLYFLETFPIGSAFWDISSSAAQALPCFSIITASLPAADKPAQKAAANGF